MLNGEYVDCDNTYSASLKKDCASGQPCMTGESPVELTKAECEMRCIAEDRCRYFSSYQNRDCVLHFTDNCNNPEAYPDSTVTRQCTV
jgi:hypothetical protein